MVFSVADRLCALRRDAVRELLPLPRLSRPPTLPPPLAGFVNLAGEPVPVLALGRLLGLEEAQPPGLYDHLILLREEAAPAALLVRRVLDLTTPPAGAVRPVADAATLNGCVEAEFDWGGRLVHLLSPTGLLLEQERRALLDLTDAARRRLMAWGGDLA